MNGSGAAVFENPVNSLVFLAEELGKFGHTLKAGGKTAIHFPVAHLAVALDVCRIHLSSLLSLAKRIRSASDFIITGATCILPPTDYEEGDIVQAEFVGLGTVTLNTGGDAKL